MCEEFATDMALLAAGKLPEARRFATEAHLGDCPTCRADLADWRKMAAAVAVQQARRAPSLPAYIPITEAVPAAPYAAWPARLLVGLFVGVLLWTAWLGSSEESPSRTGINNSQEVRPVDSAPVRDEPVLRRTAPAAAAAQSVASASGDALAPPPIAGAEPGTMTLRTAPDQPPAQPAAPSALALSPLLPANPPVAVLAMPPAPTTPVPDDLSPAPLPEPSERSTDVPTATASPPSAVVTGVVTGADGLPRAEVRVVARAWDGGVAEVARTGVDGSYRLSLGAGRWALSTEAPAYAAAWYPNRTEPLSAVAIEGAAGSVTSADFVLTAAPDGRIEGVVLDEAGEPVPGALVVAAPTAAGVASVGGLAAAVIADAAGAYRLPLAPGAWFVAAAADWRGGRLAWWQGVGSGAAAEAVLVPDDSSSVNLALRISTVDP